MGEPTGERWGGLAPALAALRAQRTIGCPLNSVEESGPDLPRPLWLSEIGGQFEDEVVEVRVLFVDEAAG